MNPKIQAFLDERVKPFWYNRARPFIGNYWRHLDEYPQYHFVSLILGVALYFVAKLFWVLFT